jgi:predicted SAM-dependent methyltransferase
MKARIRSVVRSMADWPGIGRIVRIGVAVVRLPEFRAEFLASTQRNDGIDGAPVARVDQSAFATEQLPTVLQTLAELNHRQLASDSDRANLVKSVPVALRRMVRDIIDTRADLRRLEQSVHAGLEARDRCGDALDSVEFLLGRVEFVRRELLFQMRYGGAAPARLEATGDILRPEKVAAARQLGARVNLGCGHIALDGYLNIDRRALPGVDIVAEVDRLPFGQRELAEIFSAHLLEHFPQEQLRRSLLPYYFGLLRPGGKFSAVVPDAEAMLRHYAAGSYPYDDLREVLYGGQDYDGDFHFNMFTPASMSDYLREAGFVNPQVLASGRRNGRCYELEITAERPHDATAKDPA